jgi:nifR3 family TIM-barrel protein
MPETMSILNKIKGKAVLAPMLATTDIPFRAVCRSHGAALTFTEMVSAAGILRAASNSYRNAVFSPDEHPIGIQLVAADADDAAAAVRELLPLKPDLFDLNCGCPNERICEAGAGAQLLDDLPRLVSILRAAAAASPVPVSVKLRLLDRRDRRSVRDLMRTVEDSGVTLITLHARTRTTPYDEPAAWDAIAEAVDSVAVPIVGNGDIFSARHARRMMRETGCAAVMVARGALGTPWIFRDIAEGRDCEIDTHAPDPKEMARLIDGHLSAITREFGGVRSLPRLRKHVLWYARRYPGTKELRARLFATDSPDSVRDVAQRFFDVHPPALPVEDPSRIDIERRFRERVLYWTTTVTLPEG